MTASIPLSSNIESLIIILQQNVQLGKLSCQHLKSNLCSQRTSRAAEHPWPRVQLQVWQTFKEDWALSLNNLHPKWWPDREGVKPWSLRWEHLENFDSAYSLEHSWPAKVARSPSLEDRDSSLNLLEGYAVFKWDRYRKGSLCLPQMQE